MNIDTFFSHWNLSENPFVAEEARDDLVYQRIMALGVAHPDFEKLFGNPGKPSTAVVFGEKGSGKTALRLLMEDRLKEYNKTNPDKKSWIVHYDEFNHFVDRVAGGNTPKAFSKVRTEDHMDKIMSLVVTDLADTLTNPKDEENAAVVKKVRSMPRQQRLDLACLVFLYDQPSLEHADRPLAEAGQGAAGEEALPSRVFAVDGVGGAFGVRGVVLGAFRHEAGV